MELTIFGQLKIPKKFSINLNLKILRLLNFLLTGRLFRRLPNILLATKSVLFFTSDVYKNYNLWSCQHACDALVYLLDNIFIIWN